jgi:4'-phosphopantetheinyl transferase
MSEGLEVVAARLDVPPDEVRALRECLSPAEHARAARLRFEHLRRRYIVSRARLRQLLGARLGLEPRAVALAYGANGKPLLESGALHFSVSHCDDVALIALSPVEIGVDIEALRPVPEADAIAEQVFSPREKDAYAVLAAHDKLLAFLHCWTRKEALVKALGEGLALSLERLDAARASRWWLHSFVPLPGFVAALACYRG